jgi:pSer/pThr/pTyr-binding forkhead associated (FHA) protein
MRLLERGGKTFTIPVGEVALGSDASCAVSLSGTGILPRHAIVRGQADGQVIIRKASPAADVLINGVRLGEEPTPLLHGDKVEIGGHELSLVDERRSGSTQYMSKVQVPETVTQAEATTKPRVTGNTGGRIVSLTDGREYVITGPSLVFGRDAECGVVVAGKDVSRRHAEIIQTQKGYVLVDSSTNGTFVNDERVQGQRVLQRVDVIRIGEESFRFYADVVAARASAQPEVGMSGATGPPAGAPRVASPPKPQPPPPPPPLPPAGAAERLKHTVHGVQAVPRPSGSTGASGAPDVPTPAERPDAADSRAPADSLRPLASLLVRRGGLKGHRLQVRTPVVNIGRADYNDLVLPDPSVSTAHAKLQRRESVWLLLDLDSTNGTFVDGDPVKGESPIAPGSIIRFGDVELVFEPADDALGVVKGGGTQLLRTPQSLAAFSPPAPKPAVPAAPAAPAAPVGPAAQAAKPAPAAPAAPAPPPPSRASPASPARAAAAGAPAPPKAPAKAKPLAKGRPAAKGARGAGGAAAQTPEQQGKGCRSSAAVFILGAAGVLAILQRLLA